MAVSFSTPSRTVLLTSDDALYIYSSGAEGVKLVAVMPWDSDDFVAQSTKFIQNKCGSKPVLILNDMVEQHYRKERVPHVSFLDKAGVLKRKLLVSFPNYPIREALPLKEKLQGSGKAGKGGIYIFSAIPTTDQLLKTVAIAKKSLAAIIGLSLLPVESASMVEALSSKITKKGERKSTWSIFIGQQKNGSVRQVVTRNGELALTRLTPIIDSDDDPQRWVSEVHQEFKATMSYLARFGYSQDEGLDVIVISDPKTSELLRAAMDSTPCNFKSLSVFQAATLLGVSIGRQDNARHADVLHVAWSARKLKLTMPMRSKEVNAVMLPRFAAKAAAVLMLVAAGYMGGQLLQYLPKSSDLKQKISHVQKQESRLADQYLIEAKRKEGVGFDVVLVENSLAVYEELENQNISPLVFLRAIGNALGEGDSVQNIVMTRDPEVKKPPQYDASGELIPEPSLYTVEISLKYPGTINLIVGNRKIEAIKERIQEALPDHKVSVSKFLKDFGYTEKFVIETGLTGDKEATQDFIAKIEIQGSAT